MQVFYDKFYLFVCIGNFGKFYCGKYSPVYTTLNFWYGTGKIGARTTFLVLGLPI
jgi:hypothetical protein